MSRGRLARCLLAVVCALLLQACRTATPQEETGILLRPCGVCRHTYVYRVEIDGMPCLYTTGGGITCDWGAND